MSSTINICYDGFSTTKAVAYNIKAAASVGWKDSIPQAAIKAVPGLALHYDDQDFALAVYTMQHDVLSFGAVNSDGMFGHDTWMAVLKRFDPVSTDSDRYYIHNDRRQKVSRPDAESIVIPFDDEDDGLDLHRFGNFSRRSKDIRYLVIHWGGRDPHHLYRVFANTSRKVSSHLGVGRHTIYQYLDLKHRAWHGGFVNDLSVGIDICQQPTQDYLQHYVDEGYDVSKITNPTGRGRTNILSLDPAIAAATREVVFDLLGMLDIPVMAPRGAKGQSSSGDLYHGVVNKDYLKTGFRGVIGHHHASATKWDMACWWDTVFAGTPLA